MSDTTNAAAPAAVAPPAAKAKNTRTLIGTIVSDKRSKTVTVQIERRSMHDLYGKIVARSPETVNPKLATGEVELQIAEFALQSAIGLDAEKRQKVETLLMDELKRPDLPDGARTDLALAAAE